MEMSAADLATHVRREFSKIIVGQTDAVDQLLLVVLARGHALIEGVPGLAKTVNVRGKGWLVPSMVTCNSSIASSSADCVRGGIRLISSTSSISVKIGPR